MHYLTKNSSEWSHLSLKNRHFVPLRPWGSEGRGRTLPGRQHLGPPAEGREARGPLATVSDRWRRALTRRTRQPRGSARARRPRPQIAAGPRPWGLAAGPMGARPPPRRPMGARAGALRPRPLPPVLPRGWEGAGQAGGAARMRGPAPPPRDFAERRPEPGRRNRKRRARPRPRPRAPGRPSWGAAAPQGEPPPPIPLFYLASQRLRGKSGAAAAARSAAAAYNKVTRSCAVPLTVNRVFKRTIKTSAKPCFSQSRPATQKTRCSRQEHPTI